VWTAGAGAWRGRVARARGAGACVRRDPGRCVGRTASACSAGGQHGCGRATWTGRASPAARALQTRLINGLWPQIPGAVQLGSPCTVFALLLLLTVLVGQAASGVVSGCDATNTRFTSFTRFTSSTRSNDFPFPNAPAPASCSSGCLCSPLTSFCPRVRISCRRLSSAGVLTFKWGSSWGPTVGGGQSPLRTPCLWPFRSEAPQGSLVLRAAPALWVWLFPIDA